MVRFLARGPAPTLLQANDSQMNAKSLIARVTQQEDINFFFSNRIPRRLATRLMGRLSRIENPWVCKGSIALWRLFSDLDLTEANSTRFKSLHACFTRELKPGARPIDPDLRHLVSPCDGLVGACGPIDEGTVLQAKGFPYPLAELLTDAALASHYEGGQYATLRLTSSMYHRFHAPADCRVEQVKYISGDAWNVNPIALNRVPKLYCKNERAVIRCRLASGALLTLVPVAAILVASIRLKFLDVLLHLRYPGPQVIPCDAALQRGEEMGWFEHGSTIIVLVPPGIRLGADIIRGAQVKMGQALLQIG
jgi:phosphatidylserine decarboxylase